MDHPGDLTNQAQKTSCDSCQGVPMGGSLPAVGPFAEDGKDFQFPAFYQLPPFFTLQPHAGIRAKQLELWKQLISECPGRCCSPKKLGGFLFRNQRNTG
jgi:hypothetical protein